MFTEAVGCACMGNVAVVKRITQKCPTALIVKPNDAAVAPSRGLVTKCRYQIDASLMSCGKLQIKDKISFGLTELALSKYPEVGNRCFRIAALPLPLRKQ